MRVEVRAELELDTVHSHTAIRVGADNSASEELCEQSESVLRSLCRLISLGAFHPAGGPKAGVIPLGSGAVSSSVLFDLTCPAVHPSVWRVIAGSIAARGASVVALESGTTARAYGWTDLLRIPRFRSMRPLPFDVRSSCNPNRAERIVQIVFERRVDIAVMRRVEPIFDDWDALLAGGFPLPSSGPGDVSARGLGTYAVDAFTIEHRISDDDHDDEAYQVLLDVIGRVHDTMAPIDYVAID
jgi:hypothetical protein